MTVRVYVAGGDVIDLTVPVVGARLVAEQAARMGFWHGSRFYPPHRVEYAEVADGNTDSGKKAKAKGK